VSDGPHLHAAPCGAVVALGIDQFDGSVEPALTLD